VYRDAAGAMLLHRFCWIPHPDPTEARRELDKLSGRSDHGRRHRPYSPSAKLAALLRAAKRLFPHCLQHRDRHGALPMHYLVSTRPALRPCPARAPRPHQRAPAPDLQVQNSSPAARDLLRQLMALHPHAVVCRDRAGNVPLHVAVASFNTGCVEELVQGGWPAMLMVPNNAGTLPSQAPGAWKVRAMFNLHSTFTRFELQCSVALGVPFSVLAAYLACSLESQHALAPWFEALLVGIFFGAFALLCLALADAAHVARAIRGDGGALSAAALVLLSLAQLRVPVESFVVLWERRGQEHWLLRLKRLQLVLVWLPVAVVQVRCSLTGHILIVLDGRFSLSLKGRCQVWTLVATAPGPFLAMRCACLALATVSFAVAATGQEAHRFGMDGWNAGLRRTELAVTLVLRLGEAGSRAGVYGVVLGLHGPAMLGLCMLAEVALMLLLGVASGENTGVRERLAGVLATELFDLCGTHNGFRPHSSQHTWRQVLGLPPLPPHPPRNRRAGACAARAA
jgi:hypothetical protein